MATEMTKFHKVKRILDKGGTLIVWKGPPLKAGKTASWLLSNIKVFPVPSMPPFWAPSVIGGREKSYYVKGKNTKALLYVNLNKRGSTIRRIPYDKPISVDHDVAMEFVNNKNDYHNRLEPNNVFWEIVSNKAQYRINEGNLIELDEDKETLNKEHKVKHLLNKGWALTVWKKPTHGIRLRPGRTGARIYKPNTDEKGRNVDYSIAMKFVNNSDKYINLLPDHTEVWHIVDKKHQNLREAISSTMDDALNDLSLEGFDNLDEIAAFYKLDPVAVRNAWGEWKDHHDVVLRIKKQKKVEQEEELTIHRAEQKEEYDKRRKKQKEQSRLGRSVTKVLKIGKDGFYDRDWVIITKKNIIEVESWLDYALNWALQDCPDACEWGRYMLYMIAQFKHKGWDPYSAQAQILPRAIDLWEKHHNKNAGGTGESWENYAAAVEQEVYTVVMDSPRHQ